MKAFIAVVLLVALASAEYKVKTEKDLDVFRDECVKKLDVPAELVEKYKSWQYPNDPVTHCYIMCMMEKFELFNKDTGFSVENVNRQIAIGGHVAETYAKIESCADKNTQGSTACEWAYRGAMCFIPPYLPLVHYSLRADSHAQNAHQHDH